VQAVVVRNVEMAVAALGELGATIVEADWVDAEAARATSLLINRIETSAVHAPAIGKEDQLYGGELRLRVRSFALLPSTVYLRALRARSYLRASIAAYFRDNRLDLMVTPSAPAVAAPADDLEISFEDGSHEHVSFAYTRLAMPFNITGLPAMSLPCGLDEAGLPVGVQFAGPPGSEALLLAAGEAFEQTAIGEPMRPPQGAIR
jgi:aspartyl-tRNA(Asn)/glutamyl-tRNA(Gln) amidotransferase subunit A